MQHLFNYVYINKKLDMFIENDLVTLHIRIVAAVEDYSCLFFLFRRADQRARGVALGTARRQGEWIDAAEASN